MVDTVAPSVLAGGRGKCEKRSSVKAMETRCEEEDSSSKRARRAQACKRWREKQKHATEADSDGGEEDSKETDTCEATDKKERYAQEDSKRRQTRARPQLKRRDVLRVS